MLRVNHLLLASAALAVMLPGAARAQGQDSPPAVGEVAPIPVPDRPVESFEEAIALTYANNPQLLSQRAETRSTDHRYASARARYGMTLDFDAVHAWQRDRSELLPGTFVGDQGFAATARAIVTQPLFTFGRLRANENVALTTIAFARDTLRLTEAQVLLNATSAYIGVQRDLALVAIAEQNLALLDRQLRDSRERFRVREITSADLQQIETRVEFGQAQLLTAQGNLATSRSQFIRHVGAMPGTLGAAVRLEVPAATLEDALNYSDANSPVIRAAQSRERVSRATVEVGRAEFGPRVDLRGSGVYGPLSPYANADRATQMRGEVIFSMPIADAGLRNAQLREAVEANDSDWRLIDAARRDTRQAVSGSWNQLVAARSSIDNYRRAVESAQRAYDGAVIQERAGARTTLDVLDLARDLLTVRTSYVTALASEYLARASLLASMGRLEAQYIAPEVPRYDPAEHFRSIENDGGMPGVTDLLSALDGLTVGDTEVGRAVRDPAAGLIAPAAPLPADAVPPITAATGAP